MANRRPAGQSVKNTTKPAKMRIDVLLVRRGLAPSRERAQALLLAGQVRANGVPVTKAGAQVHADARIEITGGSLRYVSRGGGKLEGALDDFGVTAEDKVCLDVGSSTGGFTDCLLQRGARKVFAVDVNIDQLDWKLRQNPRVVAVKRNARYLRSEDLGEPIDLVVVDVSFISVAKVLPAIVPITTASADFLILIKPQFELDRREIAKGGIVRSPELHQQAIQRVTAAAYGVGLEIRGLRPSHVKGAGGNQEFFLHARRH